MEELLWLREDIELLECDGRRTKFLLKETKTRINNIQNLHKKNIRYKG